MTTPGPPSTSKGIPVRIIANDDIARVARMSDFVTILQRAYRDLADDAVAYVPLIWLYAPTGREDDYHRCSATTGNSAEQQVTAIRIKSDIIGWPGGAKETKYARKPGDYCGLILLFSNEDAQPLAILHDGVIQHMRVGASAAIGADIMARADAHRIGLLGSGGMARTYVEAMCQIRAIDTVRVYSPTRSNASAFAREMTDKLGVDVSVVASGREALRDADIAITATSSIQPTIDPDWIAPGTHITCVQRRELSADLYDRADWIAQLGYNSLPSDSEVPGLQRVRGGLSAYVAGSAEEQARIPRGGEASKRSYPTITDLLTDAGSHERDPDSVSLFLTVGTQGVQFSAVAGHVYRRCVEQDLGHALPADWFLQQIRN